jgi:AcrR family transcriptional regulator
MSKKQTQKPREMPEITPAARARPTRSTPVEAFSGSASPPKPERLRDARARQVRERILDAATTIFAEKGLDGATLQEIAEASGARQTLALYHFGSKGALWEAVAERLATRFDALQNACFERQAPPASDRERVHAVFVSFAQALRELPAYGRMLLQESYRPSPRLLWREHHLIPRAHRPMAFADPALMQALGGLSLLRAAVTGAMLFIVTAGPQLAVSAAEQGGEPPAELDPLSERMTGRLAALLCELVFSDAGEKTAGTAASAPSQLGLLW